MPPQASPNTPSLLELRHLSAIGWSLAGRGAMIGGTLLINAFAARLFDQAAFGQFLLCVSIVTVMGMVCPLGANATAVRNLGASLRTGERGPILSLVSTILAAALLGGTIFVLIAPGPGAGFLYQIISAGRANLSLLLATALWTAGFGIQLTLAEVLRAAGRIHAASFAGGALSALGLAALLGLMWAFASPATPEHVLLYQTAIVAVSILIFMPYCAATYGGLPIRVDVARLPGLIWDSLPGGMIYPLFNFMVQADVFALGWFRPGDVAIYGVANRLVLLLTVPGVVLEAALAQIYAAKILAGNLGELRHLAQEAACLALLAALPMLGLYLLGGGDLTAALFGPGYGDSGRLLAILSCGYIAASATGQAGLILILSGRQRLALCILCGFLVPYLTAIALAARFGGAQAVALCVMIGIWGMYLVLALAVRRSLGVWVIATPQAMRGLFHRGLQAWRAFVA